MMDDAAIRPLARELGFDDLLLYKAGIGGVLLWKRPLSAGRGQTPQCFWKSLGWSPVTLAVESPGICLIEYCRWIIASSVVVVFWCAPVRAFSMRILTVTTS